VVPTPTRVIGSLAVAGMIVTVPVPAFIGCVPERLPIESTVRFIGALFEVIVFALLLKHCRY